MVWELPQHIPIRMCGKLVNYDAYVMYEETLNIICGCVEYPALRIDLRRNQLL